MEFATLIDFYDFERTDAEPREGAVSTSGIYRQDKGPSLKMDIYGRDGKKETFYATIAHAEDGTSAARTENTVVTNLHKSL